MVLTFTSSISVVEHGQADTRTVLVAAVGCNLAWGIVDAAMYLMSNFTERARALLTFRALRDTQETGTAHRLIADALPSTVSAVLTPSEVETLRLRLTRQPEPSAYAALNRADFAGALGVFLLVFLSTLPVVAPFLVMKHTATAMRTSNAIAMVMLFVTGWSLGKYAGRSSWYAGAGMVAMGLVLVAITMALGG